MKDHEEYAPGGNIVVLHEYVTFRNFSLHESLLSTVSRLQTVSKIIASQMKYAAHLSYEDI